tara:strand:- start:295 stop:549 length:255 start_codon:yes stop_codon:yes gene_type:complete
MVMNIFTVLSLRSQWETLVQSGRGYNLPSYEGTINNIEHFVNEGYKKNRFRKNYKLAMQVAKEILGEVYGDEERIRRRAESETK